jgi:hypothetical protein
VAVHDPTATPASTQAEKRREALNKLAIEKDELVAVHVASAPEQLYFGCLVSLAFGALPLVA